MGGRRSLILFMCLLLIAVAVAEEYELQWQVPTSNNLNFYADWARNKTFKVGDSITFNWTGLHTVANVSKPGYDRCVKRGSIQRSSPAKIALSSGGNHFFICTIDSHCQRGQKLSVAVTGRAGRYLPTVFGPFLAVVSAILLHSLSFHG